MALGLKTIRLLLASAARAASTASPVQTDVDAQGLRLYLNVSAVSGVGGLSVVIRGYDRFSATSVELTGGGDVVNQIGTYAYEMSFAPDPPFGNLRDAASRSVPYQWDAVVKHVDGSQYTYSLSAEIVK